MNHASAFVVQVEDVAEADRDGDEHHDEIEPERQPAAERFGERRQDEAAEDRSGRQQHRPVRSEPRRSAAA